MTTDWTEVKRDSELRLNALMRHRAELEAKLQELTTEETNLRTVVAMAEKMAEPGYWQSLMALEVDAAKKMVNPEVGLRKHLEQIGRPQETSGRTELREEPVARTSSPKQYKNESPLPPALGVTRQPDDTNTSYRIAALMRDHERPMDFDEVWQKFDENGWIDPEWARPTEAVLQAMRRTEKYGWTKRLGSRRFVYDPSFHEARRGGEQRMAIGGEA